MENRQEIKVCKEEKTKMKKTELEICIVHHHTHTPKLKPKPNHTSKCKKYWTEFSAIDLDVAMFDNR